LHHLQENLLRILAKCTNLGIVSFKKDKKGITVRFEDDEMAKLEQLGARYQVSSATILRWALQALVEYVEINGGRIILPLDFSNLSPLGRTEADCVQRQLK